MNKTNSIRLLRHATLVLRVGGFNLLVDPMLSPKEALDPVQNCGNDIRIPMVDLPVSSEELDGMIGEADAVVVTHLHRDHWDAAAQALIPKDKTILCQPCDAGKLRDQGFSNVVPIEDHTVWNGLAIYRTGGQHGAGEIGHKMGEVSGIVFKDHQQTIYLAGDTIWCKEVEQALSTYQPDITIVNAGGAQFLSGGPITMTPEHILKVHQQRPHTKIIAVHMDAVNHCFVKRTDLQKALSGSGLTAEAIIPADGELIKL